MFILLKDTRPTKVTSLQTRDVSLLHYYAYSDLTNTFQSVGTLVVYGKFQVTVVGKNRAKKYKIVVLHPIVERAYSLG